MKILERRDDNLPVHQPHVNLAHHEEILCLDREAGPEAYLPSLPPQNPPAFDYESLTTGTVEQ